MREQDGKEESPDYISYVERKVRDRRMFARWAEFGGDVDATVATFRDWFPAALAAFRLFHIFRAA